MVLRIQRRYAKAPYMLCNFSSPTSFAWLIVHWESNKPVQDQIVGRLCIKSQHTSLKWSLCVEHRRPSKLLLAKKLNYEGKEKQSLQFEKVFFSIWPSDVLSARFTSQLHQLCLCLGFASWSMRPLVLHFCLFISWSWQTLRLSSWIFDSGCRGRTKDIASLSDHTLCCSLKNDRRAIRALL